MNESEAFEVLGLDPSASEEEIEEKYRELAQEHHPDKEGDKEEFAKLSEAKKIALGQEEPHELELVEQAIENYTEIVLDQQQKREKSRKTVNRLIRYQTYKYRRRKQMTILLGGSLGILTLFSTFLDIPVTQGNSFSLIITASAIFVGIMYWTYHVQTENITTLITEADEALENNVIFVNLLQNIGIHKGDGTSFTQQELVDKINEWTEGTSSELTLTASSIFLPPEEVDFEQLAKIVGPTDFSKLLIRKGLANNLIAEDEISKGDELTVTYQTKSAGFETASQG